MSPYYEFDFDGFVGDFAKMNYVEAGQKMLQYFDGHLHLYNGRYFEQLDDHAIASLIMPVIREYRKKLSFVDKKNKETKVSSTPTFYKAFLQTLCDLCVPNKDELALFRERDPDLVFGKTQVYRISTGKFVPYNILFRSTCVLDFDVAEDDSEPDVWKEFFEAAGMDEAQQISWWYQRAVILMRDDRHNRIFYLWGNPRAGKGITVGIDSCFFGQSNVASIPRNIGSDSHALEVIVGKPLLLINDMKFDKSVNNGFIQFLLNFVGKDPIIINPKYKMSYPYLPVANLEITSNERPNFMGNLSGMENKFVFNVFRRDDNKKEDLTLKRRMLDTMPQIVRKAARMYGEAIASNYAFDTPQGLLIRDQFAESASSVIRFVKECCEISPEFNDRTQDVYDIYRNYAQQQGEHRASLQQFVNEILTYFCGKITKERPHLYKKRRSTLFSGMRRIGVPNALDAVQDDISPMALLDESIPF